MKVSFIVEFLEREFEGRFFGTRIGVKGRTRLFYRGCWLGFLYLLYGGGFVFVVGRVLGRWFVGLIIVSFFIGGFCLFEV